MSQFFEEFEIDTTNIENAILTIVKETNEMSDIAEYAHIYTFVDV